MDLKIKRLTEEAVLPMFARQGDAGLDLTAVSVEVDMIGNIVYGTGIAVEIPEGHVGLLFPRSSNSKQDLLLSNSVGVIDSGYRGEIILKYKFIIRNGLKISEHNRYNIGDRVGQLVIVELPKVNIIEVSELSTSERGEGGFGSTGK